VCPAARSRWIETAVAAAGAARARHEAAARGATVPAAAHQGAVGGYSGERKEVSVLSFRVPTGSLPFMRIRDGFQPLDLINGQDCSALGLREAGPTACFGP
jgi:hypothetical protein